MKRKTLLVSFFIFILFIHTACGKKEETDAYSSANIENIPQAAETVEDMNNQNQGILVEKYLKGRELAQTLKYDEIIESDLEPSLHKKIDSFAQSQKSSEQSFYNYLVYLLGSGEYGKIEKELETFEPVFPEVTADQKKKKNAVILMDGSQSMEETLGNQTKLSLAKKAIIDFAAALPNDESITLLTYENPIEEDEETQKVPACRNIQVAYDHKPYEPGEFASSLAEYREGDNTSFTAGLQKAEEILSSYSDEQYENSIYIISDGIDICEDEGEESRSILSNGSEDIHIIGLDVDQEEEAALQQVAAKGTYKTVATEEELQTYIKEEWEQETPEKTFVQEAAISDEEQLSEQKRFDSIKESYDKASIRERDRLLLGVKYIEEQKLLSAEEVKRLEKRVLDQYKSRKEAVWEIRDQKLALMKAKIKENNKMIQEWKDKWQ
jgi:hypothetical protein